MSEVKAVATNWDKLDVGIEHQGRAITLPAEPGKMPLNKAIEALVRKQKDEDQIFMVYELFDAYPYDAAVAVTKAMTNLYGWASPQTEIVQGFFGLKKIPPRFLSVKIGIGEFDVIQVPMGEFELPGLEHAIKTLIHPEVGFVITGEIKKRDKHVVLELATEARRILKTESIYRGKPIRLMVDEDGDLVTDKPPIFLDVTEMVEEDLIFDDEVHDQINTNLLVPIKETARCRQHKIPLRRGILLEGPYGTGKSLTARLTARVAEQNGWTFVLLDKVQGLKHALEFAVKYSPCVVFAEDIDRIIEERTDGANDLINTIDGVGNKTSEIMTVLTTNFVFKINPVILRPGRLDAVISLRPPNEETCEKLVRHYAGNLLSPDVTLKNAVKNLKGLIPASIRECVDRAKLTMIGRKADHLSESDINVAAHTMQFHMKLLEEKKPEASNGELLATALRKAVVNGSEELIEHIHRKVNDLHANM